MQKKTLKKLAPMVGMMAALNAASAFAETTPPANLTSEATTKSLLNTLKEKGVLNYTGVYHGPTLGNLSTTQQSDSDGKFGSDPQDIENVITAGYKVNSKTTVGANAHFMYYFAGKPVGTGQNITMLDPAMYISRSGLIDRGDFKVSGQLFVTPGVTRNDLYTGNIAAAISPVANITYNVPKSRLTLGLYNKISGYIPQLGASGTSAITQFKVVIGPNANYQITDKVAATLWVDLVSHRHQKNSKDKRFFNANDLVDFQPGINWDITKNISVNPIVTIFPSNLTLEATSFQALFVANVF